MKLKNYLLAASIVCVAAGFASCKKDNNSSNSGATEIAATVELSGDQAVSDNTNADAENVLNEAAVDNSFSGSTPVGINTPANTLSCAVVTVSTGPFPKTITIDFGTGCTSADGITRSGTINVTLSDSLRHPGSIAVMTFNNYYVSGFKKEGTITWTNTSTQGTKSWERKCENGKITAPNGRFWLHSGTQDVVQTGGPNFLTIVFTITGNTTVTNSNGVSRTATITSPLEKKVACSDIDKGTIKIQGPNHYATLDYGDGTCDDIATISIDGGTPIQFLLR